MRIRRHSDPSAHAALSKARENHPAPLANEGGRLYWYRTREAVEEALIPVALPTQLDCPTQAASDPPRHVEYKVGGEHLEPELSSKPEKASHRRAMTQMEEIASKDYPHIHGRARLPSGAPGKSESVTARPGVRLDIIGSALGQVRSLRPAGPLL